MAAWTAQNRGDVSSTVIVAPFLGARIIPTGLTRLAALGVRGIPDLKLWWDPQKKLELDGPKYGYPRFSTHSLAQILKLAFETADAANRMPPNSRCIRMILNAHDESVNNVLAYRLVASWQHWPGVDVESFTIPDELGIPHDCISVEQPTGQPDLVYAKILEMIG